VSPKFSKNPGNVLEDTVHGFRQIGNNPYLLLAFLLLLFSIAFFNFAGITITKMQTATSRCSKAHFWGGRFFEHFFRGKFCEFFPHKNIGQN
jgi:hypothetical protein